MPKAKTTEQFIVEASKIHNNKYTYQYVDYINNKTKVIIDIGACIGEFIDYCLKQYIDIIVCVMIDCMHSNEFICQD